MEYKGFNIKNDGSFGYKTIHNVGSGTLPTKLKGLFTTVTFAKKAIDIYTSEKEKSDAGAKSTSRGK